jgi:hypothetical protein
MAQGSVPTFRRPTALGRVLLVALDVCVLYGVLFLLSIAWISWVRAVFLLPLALAFSLGIGPVSWWIERQASRRGWGPGRLFREDAAQAREYGELQKRRIGRLRWRRLRRSWVSATRDDARK